MEIKQKLVKKTKINNKKNVVELKYFMSKILKSDIYYAIYNFIFT